MNNRAIDLRTGFSQAIFRISSVACQLLRQFLLKRSFIEVHTPCLLEETHRHHNESFELNYFGPSQTLRSRTSTTNNSVFWAVMIVPSQLAQPLGNFTEIPISIWNWRWQLRNTTWNYRAVCRALWGYFIRSWRKLCFVICSDPQYYKSRPSFGKIKGNRIQRCHRNAGEARSEMLDFRTIENWQKITRWYR